MPALLQSPISGELTTRGKWWSFSYFLTVLLFQTDNGHKEAVG